MAKSAGDTTNADVAPDENTDQHDISPGHIDKKRHVEEADSSDQEGTAETAVMRGLEELKAKKRTLDTQAENLFQRIDIFSQNGFLLRLDHLLQKHSDVLR